MMLLCNENNKTCCCMQCEAKQKEINRLKDIITVGKTCNNCSNHKPLAFYIHDINHERIVDGCQCCTCSKLSNWRAE